MTDVALAYYSDDDLHGFADIDFSARSDGKPLLQQQRSLVVPYVEDAIRKLGAKIVVEIGTGNGDIAAHLSGLFPDTRFIGIDLSVKNAVLKHSGANTNLSFEKGYALDLFRAGLSGDVVFASSTFCIFAPKELAAYIDAIKGVRTVILSDPVHPGFERIEEPSRHMDLYMWRHDYAWYFKNAGWSVEHDEIVTFAYSHNPNAKVAIFVAHWLGTNLPGNG